MAGHVKRRWHPGYPLCAAGRRSRTTTADVAVRIADRGDRDGKPCRGRANTCRRAVADAFAGLLPRGPGRMRASAVDDRPQRVRHAVDGRTAVERDAGAGEGRNGSPRDRGRRRPSWRGSRSMSSKASTTRAEATASCWLVAGRRWLGSSAVEARQLSSMIGEKLAGRAVSFRQRQRVLASRRPSRLMPVSTCSAQG
jgi:hypothetical protein